MKNNSASPRPPEWIVYILRCSDGSLYTGVTNSLKRRIESHNRGTASKYTRSRRPVSLLATSAAMSRGDALRLEIMIKRLPKANKIDALKTPAIHLRAVGK